MQHFTSGNSARVQAALAYAKENGLLKVDDPGINLFRHSRASVRLTSTDNTDDVPLFFKPGGRYLDLGCCEADWLHEEAHKRWPLSHFVGLDWRAPNTIDGDGMVWRRQGDGLMAHTFEPESFDGIVSLSAIEHFGLGHYSQDPKDVDGDTHAIANCWRWLKPGGFLYFDVPYNPNGYRVVNTTEYRTYDDDALWFRLWMQPLVDTKMSAKWHFTGYCDAHKTQDGLIPKPIEQPDDRLRYYVSLCWQKVGPR